MATWELGITTVILSMECGVAAAETCIQAPAAARIPLIVGSLGMAMPVAAEAK